mmetsp:Transcript_18883/g.72773  ORF Transcript_18883/g.72773 Transcript_18883/m.72773 type:complete len:86 (+) Transcript_18883:216-473(+)
MSCPKCGPSRAMTTVCRGCGGRLEFGDPNPRHAHPVTAGVALQRPSTGRKRKDLSQQPHMQAPMKMQLPADDEPEEAPAQHSNNG